MLTTVSKPYRVSPRRVGQILEGLMGILPDEGKSLENYKEKRLAERYEPLG